MDHSAQGPASQDKSILSIAPDQVFYPSEPTVHASCYAAVKARHYKRMAPVIPFQRIRAAPPIDPSAQGTAVQGKSILSIAPDQVFYAFEPFTHVSC